VTEWIAGPWGPILIFFLRLTDVSMATVRTLLIHRGRAWVPVIGFFEMCVWVVAVGATVTNLTSVAHLLAFAGGFAAGNWLGIRIEERMALGLAILRVFVKEAGNEVASFLRAAGFGVTVTEGQGKDGPVYILHLAIFRREVPRVTELLEVECPDAFVVVEEPRTVQRGFMGANRRRALRRA
jgi:uncharacterized protein YebE (UPF0316 family)